VRSDDFLYAAAMALLFAWLVIGALNGSPERADVAAPPPAPRAVAPPSGSDGSAAAPPRPRIAATATIDARRFYILVGEGSTPWSVAVSADD
jgi:hypothetical protein